jgi:hypothetical protein
LCSWAWTRRTPGILFRHLDHKLFDLLNDTRSPERLAMLAPVELLRNEAVIPAYERIRHGNRGDLVQERLEQMMIQPVQ